MKKCISCNKILDETYFYKKGGKNKDKGYQSRCKKCFNIQTKIRSEKNKTRIKEYNVLYYQENKEELSSGNKKRYELNKEYLSDRAKKKYKSNPQYFLEKTKNYINDVKSDPIKYNKFKDKRNKYHREWNKKNPHISVMRNQIRNIKESLGTIKKESLNEELGYSPVCFKNHIESQFQENMTWDNIGIGEGKWNIDHKIPISWFKRETPFKIVNHLSNLWPIWWEENISKFNNFSNNTDEEYYNLAINYIKEELLNIDRT